MTQYVIEELTSGIPYRKALLEVFNDIALRGCADEQIALPLIAAVLDLHPPVATGIVRKPSLEAAAESVQLRPLS